MNNKIVEHIKRDETTQDSLPTRLNISSIAALQRVDDLEDRSLFEVSVATPAEGLADDGSQLWKYGSRSVQWSTIMAKLQSSSYEHFNNAYLTARFDNLSPHLPELNEIETTVWKFLTDQWDPQGGYPIDDFTETRTLPYVWNDVWALAVGEIVLDKWLKSLDDRVTILENTRIAFSNSMRFNTTLSVFQGDSGDTRKEDSEETMARAYEDAGSGVNSKAFIMAFFQDKKLSTTYVCKETGILSIYGWLDSTNVANSKYLPTAWCALKGKMRAASTQQERWEILQVQPVTPAKQFTYVSFCIPVQKGLEVQLELGFVPGTASGRYDRNKVPESLANTVPNAFLGGVYVPVKLS